LCEPAREMVRKMGIQGRHAAIWLSVLLSLGLAACGGGGGGSSSPPPATRSTPTVTVTPGSASITTLVALSTAQSVTVTVSGSSGTPSGTVTLNVGAYTSSAVALSAGSATFSVPAGTLTAGTDQITASYTPDVASSSAYNSSSGTGSVTVTKVAPTVSGLPAPASISTTQSLSVTVSVSGGTGAPAPTGTVTVSGGGYASAAAALSGGSATIVIPAGSLALGTLTLTATYTPDSAGSAVYSGASETGSVTVSLAVPDMMVVPSPSSITTAQGTTVTVLVSGTSGTPMVSGIPTPTGSVTLSSGSYNSGAVTLTNGSAQIMISAGALATGTDTLKAAYAPDAASSPIYASATGTGSVTVTSPVAYVLTVNSAAPSSGISITASPADNNSKSNGTTPFTLSYSSGTQITLSAAQLDNGYSFVSWSGCTSTSGSSGSNCNLTVNGNTTVTATYNQAGISSITVSCLTLSTDTSCSDSPTTATAIIGTQAQFTATVNGTGSFNHSVTWSLAPATGAGDFAATTSTTATYNTPYPAPSSVVVTATSTQNTSVSASLTVTLSPPATTTGPTLNVDVNTPNTPSENPHTISPYVYGMNAYLLDAASEKVANPGILRWGGDDTSRYNYQNNMTNSASDYYFENFLGGGGQFPNATGSTNFTQFVSTTDSAGAAALGTVPVLGWVANSIQYACGFPDSQFPGQQSYSPANCGNGVYPDGTNSCTTSGGCDLYGNSTTQANTSFSEPPPNITDTSATPTSSQVPNPSSVTATWADGTWSGGWVNSLVSNPSYGNGASGKGVAIWDLDNEPTWWDAVHRDVHPVAFTYDEVTNNGIGTALAIKSADPTALVSGPVIDYWWAYFYSKKDIENGWSSGPCYEPWSNPTDRAAHGGVPLIEYYLQQFAKYSGAAYYNMRLLDYVDIHGYFAPDYPSGSGNSVAFTTAGDTQEQITRMNGTRVFWDPAYTDPNYPQPNYITDPNYTSSCSTPLQAPQLIPMMQLWVNNMYPGTKTAIDEYNFGGMESINGAIVQADILGIFGRQGLGMSALWPSSNYSEQGPGNYAFAMYRNYDGHDSTFGNTYLYATSFTSGADAEAQLAVYAAERSSDNALTIMVINKTYGSLTSTINLENFIAAGGANAQVYQYSNANLNAIVQPGAVSVTPPAGSGTTSTISYTFPAQSITLLVVPD